MLAVGCVYSGLLATVLGALETLYPLPALGLAGRADGALIVLAGLLLLALGWALPAPERQAAAPHTRLDEFAPRFQFAEFHRTVVDAPPAAIFRAITEVTAAEIRYFRLLTWVRRLGRSASVGILNSPSDVPLLTVATTTAFLPLATEPVSELVVGTVVIAPAAARQPRSPAEFNAIRDPGYAKAAMNFRIEPRGTGRSALSTETRVFATDAVTRRRFAVYWRLIYPGSAIIRRSWLRAIRRRAERSGARGAINTH